MEVAVQNAADPKQVKKAERRGKRALSEFDGALTTVMLTPAGRYVVWQLLANCKVYGTVFAAEATVLAYNAGRQDVGHELLGLVAELQDGRLYLQMQSEAIQRAKRTDAEIAAAVEHASREVSEE